MTDMFLTVKPLSKVQSKTHRSRRKLIPLYGDDGGNEEKPVQKVKSAEEEVVDEETVEEEVVEEYLSEKELDKAAEGEEVVEQV